MRTLPRPSSITFAGFRSRCTTPRSCAPSRPTMRYRLATMSPVVNVARVWTPLERAGGVNTVSFVSRGSVMCLACRGGWYNYRTSMANYTAKDITVLEGLEPVRKRPGMYIGGVGSTGLHHLLWETLDNSVDEAMNGHASNIWITLHKD